MASVWIAVTVVVGVAMAIPLLTSNTRALGPRPDVVSMMNAMSKAQQPRWLALPNPCSALSAPRSVGG